MIQDNRGMQIRGNRGQINIASGNAQMNPTMHVGGDRKLDALEIMQTAGNALIAKLQQATPIDADDRDAAVHLIKDIQNQAEKEQVNPSLIRMLNQHLESMIPLLTGVAAFNSTISAINDFQGAVDQMMSL